MQIGALIGFFGVFVMLFLGCVWGLEGSWFEAILAYYNLPSIFVTIGGTACVFLLSYSPAEYRALPRLFMMAFRKDSFDPMSIIPTLVSLSEKARREGLLALEDNLEEIEDDFLKRSLQLVIDGTDPELVKEIMRIRISKIEDRHNDGIGLFNMLEIRAPAFGLIGTILGLVQLLKNLEDPTTLGPALAVALITTFYGVIIANAVCGPMQTKLALMNGNEMLIRNMMVDGVLAIQSGDNPRIVEEKLLAFMAAAEAKKYGRQSAES
jgi:chemotaxis protein MotA